MSMEGGGGIGGGGGQPPAGAAEAEATGPWGDNSKSALTDTQLRPVKGSTHALVPAQSGGVVLLDVALQVSPDGQVSLDPVNMRLVPVETRGNKDIRLLSHSSQGSRFNYSDRLFLLFAL